MRVSFFSLVCAIGLILGTVPQLITSAEAGMRYGRDPGPRGGYDGPRMGMRGDVGPGRRMPPRRNLRMLSVPDHALHPMSRRAGKDLKMTYYRFEQDKNPRNEDELKDTCQRACAPQRCQRDRAFEDLCMDACRPMGIPVCMEEDGPLVDTLGQGARKIAGGLFSKIFNRGGGGNDRARPMPRRREPDFMMNRGGRGYDHRMDWRDSPGRMMAMDRGFDEFGGGYDEFDEFGRWSYGHGI